MQVVKTEAPFGRSHGVEDHAALRVERRGQGPAVGSRHDFEVALVGALPRNERQSVEPARAMAVVAMIDELLAGAAPPAGRGEARIGGDATAVRQANALPETTRPHCAGLRGVFLPDEFGPSA